MNNELSETIKTESFETEENETEENETEENETEVSKTEENEIEENKNQVKIPLVDMEQQINLIIENDQIIVTLPPENEQESNQWKTILDNFKSRLLLMEKNWLPKTEVHLVAKKNLLDNRQIQTIAQILQEVELNLSLIVTNRRQTAVVAASAGYSVQQQKNPKSLIDKGETLKQKLVNPLYLRTTIRSGVEIRHAGTVMILGDVNPGGSIIAGGDVFVWGSLKGMAHAGAKGNSTCIIMALKMDPTQLRIANVVARAPDNLPEDFDPEVACLYDEGIKITSAWNFAKTNFLSGKKDNWTNIPNKSLI
jgi:septum site-determining protein MinC